MSAVQVTLCCLRCGSSKNTLLRVDAPVEGYVCKQCSKETRSPVVRVGLGRNKRRMLIGPLAELFKKIPNAREVEKGDDL